ncbi:uncharacterized protein NPIL_215621 [Nephila pilipes]|uniref:Uncharacterized protein n=1 Tax=Nephila pilipes TaxID=299642 RepID=A0A8X6TH80_NEPPI|nr:uncharacterized protein NPIL_215621 [Nephila pilipes]
MLLNSRKFEISPLQLDQATQQSGRGRGHLHGLFWIRRRFHDDGSSPPVGQRLAKPGHRGFFAGHAAQRHLGQAEGALPEDGPTPKPLVPGGLVLTQEQAQKPQSIRSEMDRESTPLALRAVSIVSTRKSDHATAASESSDQGRSWTERDALRRTVG